MTLDPVLAAQLSGGSFGLARVYVSELLLTARRLALRSSVLALTLASSSSSSSSSSPSSSSSVSSLLFSSPRPAATSHASDLAREVGDLSRRVEVLSQRSHPELVSFLRSLLAQYRDEGALTPMQIKFLAPVFTAAGTATRRRYDGLGSSASSGHAFFQ